MQAKCLLEENEETLKNYENYLIPKGASKRTIIDKLAIVRILDRKINKKFKVEIQTKIIYSYLFRGRQVQ